MAGEEGAGFAADAHARLQGGVGWADAGERGSGSPGCLRRPANLTAALGKKVKAAAVES